MEMSVVYKPLDRSLSHLVETFFLQNGNHLLEGCRKALDVSSTEALDYLKYTLDIAFNSYKNCSIIAFDGVSGHVIGFNTAYISTAEEILSRYAVLASLEQRFPKMNPLFKMQHGLLEECRPLLVDFMPGYSYFADFVLVDQSCWGRNLSVNMADECFRLSLTAEHGRIVVNSYLSISNSLAATKSSRFPIIRSMKYSDYTQLNNPFIGLDEAQMSIVGMTFTGLCVNDDEPGVTLTAKL